MGKNDWGGENTEDKKLSRSASIKHKIISFSFFLSSNFEPSFLTLFPEIEDEYGSVGGRCADLVSARVPADLEDAAGALVGVDELACLRGPDVDALVEGAGGQELAVGAEGHAEEKRANQRFFFQILQ